VTSIPGGKELRFPRRKERHATYYALAALWNQSLSDVHDAALSDLYAQRMGT
jgi:hypothetical protein